MYCSKWWLNLIIDCNRVSNWYGLCLLFLFSKVLFSANGKRFCFKSELAGSVHVFEGSVVKADVALLQKHMILLVWHLTLVGLKSRLIVFWDGSIQNSGSELIQYWYWYPNALWCVRFLYSANYVLYSICLIIWNKSHPRHKKLMLSTHEVE